MFICLHYTNLGNRVWENQIKGQPAVCSHLPISVGEFISWLSLNVCTNLYFYSTKYFFFFFSYKLGYQLVTIIHPANRHFHIWRPGLDSHECAGRHHHGISMISHDGATFARRAAPAVDRVEPVLLTSGVHLARSVLCCHFLRYLLHTILDWTF